MAHTAVGISNMYEAPCLEISLSHPSFVLIIICGYCEKQSHGIRLIVKHEGNSDDVE